MSERVVWSVQSQTNEELGKWRTRRPGKVFWRRLKIQILKRVPKHPEAIAFKFLRHSHERPHSNHYPKHTSTSYGLLSYDILYPCSTSLFRNESSKRACQRTAVPVPTVHRTPAYLIVE